VVEINVYLWCNVPTLLAFFGKTKRLSFLIEWEPLFFVLMTMTEILQEVHKIYEGDTSYPSTSEDDFITRLAFANQAIGVWENRQGVTWSELYTTHSDTLVADDFQYNAPSDFRRHAGFLRIQRADGALTYLRHIQNELVRPTIEDNQSAQLYWITGGSRSRFININPTPTTINELAGLTFYLPYYKRATRYTTNNLSTEPEMENHDFIINWTLASLYQNDQDSANSSVYFQLANTQLLEMETNNNFVASTQSSEISDVQFEGFGI
jgi:hypothetical protein